MKMEKYKLITFILFILYTQTIGTCLFKGQNEDILMCTDTNLNQLQSIENKNNILRVNITSSTIEELPDNFLPFSNINHLHMQCKIKKLHSSAFKNLQKMTILKLSNNEISSIPLDLFEELQILQTLDLSHNKLENPTLDTFYGLNRLISLDISYNRIKFIVLGALDEMRTLKYLNISNNALVQLDLNTFDQNGGIVDLDLSNNLLRTIQLGTFDQMKDLVTLNLGNNRIKDIPLGIFDQTPKILYLDLSKNNLSTFLLGIFDSLRLLNTLNLSFNTLRQGIIFLGTLDEMKNLVDINLSGCEINTLPLGFFDELKKLKTLDLSYNNLIELSPFIFDENELEVLDLSHNKLKTIEPDLVKSSIRELYLSNNLISILNVNTFTNDTFLVEVFDIRRNDISFVHNDFFDWLVNLKKFDIGGNPWECVCLSSLVTILNSRFIEYGKDNYFDGQLPSCIVGEANVCEYRITYKREDKLEFLSYITS